MIYDSSEGFSHNDNSVLSLEWEILQPARRHRDSTGEYVRGVILHIISTLVRITKSPTIMRPQDRGSRHQTDLQSARFGPN